MKIRMMRKRRENLEFSCFEAMDYITGQGEQMIIYAKLTLIYACLVYYLTNCLTKYNRQTKLKLGILNLVHFSIFFLFYFVSLFLRVAP